MILLTLYNRYDYIVQTLVWALKYDGGALSTYELRESLNDTLTENQIFDDVEISAVLADLKYNGYVELE